MTFVMDKYLLLELSRQHDYSSIHLTPNMRPVPGAIVIDIGQIGKAYVPI